jgi:GNAT superfamily N-acetyltransferase
MSTDASAELKLRPPERITRDHQVADFSSGHDSLDNCLKRRALKADAAGDAKVIVLSNCELEVIGYYAIASASVSRKVAIKRLRRNAPDAVPMALNGRFATDKSYQSRQLGRALMKDAILRIANASVEIGIRGVFAYAIDDDARKFYAKCGFTNPGSTPN